MSDLIARVLNDLKPFFNTHEIKISSRDEPQAGSCSVHLDGRNFVGTVCFWPEKTHEFLFISNSTGEPLVMETKEINEFEELRECIVDVIERAILNGQK